MSPNASHRVRPGLSSAASLITTLLISFDQEVLNQHLNLDLNLVTPEYPFFESPWTTASPVLVRMLEAPSRRPRGAHGAGGPQRCERTAALNQATLPSGPHDRVPA